MFGKPHKQDLITELYQQYGQMMYAAAYQPLQDHGLAEDAVIQSFIKLLKDKSGLIHRIPHQRMASFLNTVAYHTAIDFIRKSQREQPAGLDETEPDAVDSLEDFVIRRETVALMKTALEDMPRIYADTLVLRFYDGLEIAQIAALEGVTENNVRQRIWKGRALLRGFMRKEGAGIE